MLSPPSSASASAPFAVMATPTSGFSCSPAASITSLFKSCAAGTFRTGEAEGFLTGDAFPSEVFLAGGGFAAFAAALAAATRLAAALGFTGLRAGTALLSAVEEVGLVGAVPLLLLEVVVVVALPPPAIVEVVVVVEVFGLVVLASLGLDAEGALATAPDLEPSEAVLTGGLAVEGPCEAGVRLKELVVDAEEAADPALEAVLDPVDRGAVDDDVGRVAALAEGGAGFDNAPVVDDAGLVVGLVDDTVLAFPSEIVDDVFAGLVPAIGLADVFFAISAAVEGGARVRVPDVLTEDGAFPGLAASVFSANTGGLEAGLVTAGFLSFNFASF